MAQDSAIAGNLAWAARYSSGGAAFIGYPALSELAQRPEYRRISETIANEMTRKWVRLVSAGDDDQKSEKLKRINAAMRRFRVQDMFREAAEHDGLFGRGHIFIDAGVNDDALLEVPLIEQFAISPGSLRGFKTVEPVWTYPSGFDATNPLSPNYYRPTHWFVMGRRIHESRFLTFVQREVPDILKPAYMFGGLSMTQMAQPYVENWLRTRQSVSDLLHSFSVSGLKTDLSAMAQGSGDALLDRVQLFNGLRDNRGTMVLNKETEEFFNVSTPLATVDHLQAQSQEQMASVAGIPLVKLLGITPSGLNASSDGEIRVFYDFISSMQEHIFRDPLMRVLQILQMNEFGETDPDISFVFEPLWQASEAEKSTTRKANADAAAVYINAGVLAPDEERERLANEEDSLYPGLDLDFVPERPDVAPLPDTDPDEGEE